MPLEEAVQWIRGIMQDACESSMLRIYPSPRKTAYWWTEEIAELRRSSVLLRRSYDRTRRARNSRSRAARIEETLEAYNAAKQALRAAIKAAKARAWEKLILTLDQDPWGRPYSIVMKKLKGGAPPTTKILDPQFVQQVVATLFPVGGGGRRACSRSGQQSRVGVERGRVGGHPG